MVTGAQAILNFAALENGYSQRAGSAAAVMAFLLTGVQGTQGFTSQYPIHIPITGVARDSIAELTPGDYYEHQLLRSVFDQATQGIVHEPTGNVVYYWMNLAGRVQRLRTPPWIPERDTSNVLWFISRPQLQGPDGSSPS
jgi:hypothetical protein